VTAEGVEHPNQLALLREAGCDMAQGFLLGRSVPLDQLPPHAD
jgi:EAL domain-containing protein (putative c-di-GMP-specific phosphodiesterase class I)